jgi:hypothetical protein
MAYILMTIVTIGWLAMLGMALSMTPISSHNPGRWFGELCFQIFMICIVLGIGSFIWMGWQEVLK